MAALRGSTEREANVSDQLEVVFEQSGPVVLFELIEGH
jgi:hypothetical protein